MNQNFSVCMKHVLKHEGGYVNHPKDPGGATNKGVTQRTYDAWTGGGKDVRYITDEEVYAIYRQEYWDKAKCDELPDGLDYAVFDFAVNSGVSRAAKFLQRVVGVDDDGIIGVHTLAAIPEGDAQVDVVIVSLCQARLAWLRRLGTWSTFGKGWSRRVNDVQAIATGMQSEVSGEAGGKAEGEARRAVSVVDTLKDPKAVGGIASVATGAATLAKDSDPIQWAIAAAIVVAVAVVAYMLVRDARAD